MKDENERRKYDLIYPTLKGNTEPSRYTQKSHTTCVPKSQSESASEAAQIAALQKSKQERAARWRTSNQTFESSIFEVTRIAKKLERDIEGLASIFAAEAAVEARKNSWSTWLLASVYKAAEESEEEKAGKDRARQERRIEKDMKERRLDVQKAELEAIRSKMRIAKAEMETADSIDEAKIQYIQRNIRMREDRKRQEREAKERERVAQQVKQQQEQWEKRQREAAEALRQQREAAEAQRQYMQAARQRSQQEECEKEIKRRQKLAEEEAERQRMRYTYFDFDDESPYQNRRAACRHDGWWPKVQGRAACPECSESWTYLLKCPGCDMKACPRCQAAVRPRHRRTPQPRVRTPSPHYDYDYDW